MVGGDPTPNWTARLIAPFAFFAAVTLLVLIVQNSFDDESSSTPEPRPTPTVATEVAEPDVVEEQPEETTTDEPEPADITQGDQEFYRVRSGDTLESIAARFNTSVVALLELNPDIDPLALRPAQRIRVR